MYWKFKNKQDKSALIAEYRQKYQDTGVISYFESDGQQYEAELDQVCRQDISRILQMLGISQDEILKRAETSHNVKWMNEHSLIEVVKWFAKQWEDDEKFINDNLRVATDVNKLFSAIKNADEFPSDITEMLEGGEMPIL